MLRRVEKSEETSEKLRKDKKIAKKTKKKLIKDVQFFSQFQKIFAERFCFTQFLACFGQLYMSKSESGNSL